MMNYQDFIHSKKTIEGNYIIDGQIRMATYIANADNPCRLCENESEEFV